MTNLTFTVSRKVNLAVVFLNHIAFIRMFLLSWTLNLTGACCGTFFLYSCAEMSYLRKISPNSIQNLSVFRILVIENISGLGTVGLAVGSLE